VQKDWNGEKSFQELHKISKRATPKMWSNYLHCCALYDVVTTGKPNLLLSKMMENNLVEQRFQGLVFTKLNRIKIRLNCLSNRVTNVSRRLNFNWLMLSKTVFKLKCKKMMINDVLGLEENKCVKLLTTTGFKGIGKNAVLGQLELWCA
jgi:hypothetical protein